MARSLLGAVAMSSRIVRFLAATSFSVLAACGGHVASVEEAPNEAASGTRPTPSTQHSQPAQGCGAVPRCEEGDEEVSSASGCPQDDARCYSRSLCGLTVWCVGPELACRAIPVCQGGFVEVKTCPTEASCVPVTVCGTTILCTAPACDPDVAACEAGEKQVSDLSACFQGDGASCYERTVCGATIWCTGP